MLALQSSYMGTSHRTKYFIGRVGPETTNLSLRDHFARYGSVHIAKVEVSRRSLKSKGFAYVIFEHIDDPQSLMIKEHVLDGKSVYVDRYEDRVLTNWHLMRENSLHLQVTEIPREISQIQIIASVEILGKVLVSNRPRQQDAFNYTCNLEIQRTEAAINLIKKARIRVCKLKSRERWFISWSQLGLLFKMQKMEQNFPGINCLHTTHPSVSKKEIKMKESEQKQLQRASYEKHSKYEFIARGKPHKDNGHLANYRFNIIKPSTADALSTHAVYSRHSTAAGFVMLNSHLLNIRTKNSSIAVHF